MRICRLVYNGSVKYGVVFDDEVAIVNGSLFNGKLELSGDKTLWEDAQLLAPTEPSKVVGVGLNYVDHAAELKMEVPAEPVLFLKPPTSVIGPQADIVYPEMSRQVDYEAELAVVIGRETKNITEKEALEHILGYTCGNDITARDLQKKDGQWTRAKSFDTFTPLGPWIETDLTPGNLAIKLMVNGSTKQDSSTARMVFSVQFLVSFVSQIMILKPGDVIMTGTPPGVGPLTRGDVVEVMIEELGVLRNKVG